MSDSYNKYILQDSVSIQVAMQKLDLLAIDATIFVVDKENKFVGTITDGDIRRGLMNNLNLNSPLISFVQHNAKYVTIDNIDCNMIMNFRNSGIKSIPILDKEKTIVDVINFRSQITLLPVDAVIMAGGIGARLRPLTLETPKPLLKVGGVPIIEHNVNRLKFFGVKSISLTLRYLGSQIEEYFECNNFLGMNYVYEDEPLGTLGAITLIDSFQNDTILVMNSDLLTKIDFEDFYLFFKNQSADILVASIPYNVDVPYAVLETKEGVITKIKEKPTYSYYSNAGIYLVKRAILENIPRNIIYNATDLIQDLIDSGKNVVSYPLREYWLDIGKMEDFNKAQVDYNQIFSNGK
jgi:dTDP-glucose pyrophosphorylase